MSPARGAVRRGFTLVEVLVALVIASLAALLAHQIYATTIDGTLRLQSARHSLDRTQGAHRFLTAAFLSLEVGGVAGSFDGGPGSLRCAVWLQTPDGWFERTALVLSLEKGRLLARGTAGGTLVLASNVVASRFDYLMEPGANARWVDEWVSPVSAPLAVRVLLTRSLPGGAMVSDTTVYLIKERG